MWFEAAMLLRRCYDMVPKCQRLVIHGTAVGLHHGVEQRTDHETGQSPMRMEAKSLACFGNLAPDRRLPVTVWCPNWNRELVSLFECYSCHLHRHNSNSSKLLHHPSCWDSRPKKKPVMWKRRMKRKMRQEQPDCYRSESHLALSTQGAVRCRASPRALMRAVTEVESLVVRRNPADGSWQGLAAVAIARFPKN